jgi:Fic family protein
MRSGRYVPQPTGYRAFIPSDLPPVPPIQRDGEFDRLLSDADRALGRLDGVATVLPNPDLFVAMYVRHEAVLSSQIEGTQSTLEDVLEFEINRAGAVRPRDTEEVVNYVQAMNHGLRRLNELPLSLRLVREVHAQLLEGVRGQERMPGQFRKSQNWIGPEGCVLADAEFVPPPPQEMVEALRSFEGFLHSHGQLPELVHCGLAHAQFETIHPFLDGNGRVGRLLITLILCERGILARPLLYLSYFFKAHRSQYYDRLMAIRHDGDWEGWLKFFLRGVYEVSIAAADTARSIVKLRESHRSTVADTAGAGSSSARLLDALFEYPKISIGVARSILGCSYITAAKAVGALENLGIIEEVTGRRRNRIYRYTPYLRLFEHQALHLPSRHVPQRNLPGSDAGS